MGDDTDPEPLHPYYCYVTTALNNHSFLVAAVLSCHCRCLRAVQYQPRRNVPACVKCWDYVFNVARCETEHSQELQMKM